MNASGCRCYVKCKDAKELRSLLRLCEMGLPFVADWAENNIDRYQNRFPVYVHISDHGSAGVVLNGVDVTEPSGQYAVVIDYEELALDKDGEQ